MRSLRLVSLLLPLSVATTGNAAERCAVLFSATHEGQIEHRVLPSLSVAGLAAEQPFVLPPDAPHTVKAIQCGRESLLPEPNDYKLLLAGYPLSIVAGGRIGVLEAVTGQLRFRMLEGEMTELESTKAQEALNAAQDLFNGQAAVAP